MNIYLSKIFTRLARRDGMTDTHICQAIDEMNEGLIDADLGAGLFKKRIAIPGQGKRGGWRSLLGFQVGNRAFFLYLFPKSRRESIDAAELKALKRLSKYYLTLKPAEIEAALQCGELREVNCNEKRI